MRSLTLDDGPTREAALRDPTGFVAGLDAPVLIDEIQRAPDLLLADAERIEHDDQVTGKACETLVAVELLKHASWAQHEVRLHHYQREREDIDLVLEDRAGNVAAVEVKAKASISPRDWKWLAALRDARGARFRSGVVICSGEQTVPLGDRLWAVRTRGCGPDQPPAIAMLPSRTAPRRRRHES